MGGGGRLPVSLAFLIVIGALSAPFVSAEGNSLFSHDFVCDVAVTGRMFSSSFALGHSCGLYGPCVNLPDVECNENGQDCIAVDQCPDSFGGVKVRKVSDMNAAHVLFSNGIDEMIPPWPPRNGSNVNQLRVVIGGEPLSKYPDWLATHFTQNPSAPFDLSIGYSPHRFDMHMNYMPSDAMVLWDMPPVPRRLKKGRIAAFITSGFSENNRTGILETIMKDTAGVDSYGALLKNAYLDPALEVDSVAKSPVGDYRRHAMVQTLKNYRFALAFENTNERDYVSEKLFIALESGAIPVYLGAPNVLDYWPIPDSFINANDFKSVQDLIAFIDKVDSDEELYNTYMEWKTRPPPHSVLIQSSTRSHRWNVCRACFDYVMHATAIQHAPAGRVSGGSTVSVHLEVRTEYASAGVTENKAVQLVSRLDESSYGTVVAQCKQWGSASCSGQVVRLYGGMLQMKKNALLRWGKGLPFRALEDTLPATYAINDVLFEAEVLMRASSHHDAAATYKYALEHADELGLSGAERLFALHGQGAAMLLMGYPATALPILESALSKYRNEKIPSSVSPTRPRIYHLIMDMAATFALLDDYQNAHDHAKFVVDDMDVFDAQAWMCVAWASEQIDGTLSEQAKHAYAEAVALNPLFLDIPLWQENFGGFKLASSFVFKSPNTVN